MKITTISKVASLVISSVMIQTAVAGHAVGIGVGPHSDGGRFGGIFGMLFGGGGSHSAPASGGDARFSFGHPTFGHPVIVRPHSRITTSPGRLTIPSHQRHPISSINHQSTANARPKITSRKRLTSAFN
jgi:hypothetical protein